MGNIDITICKGKEKPWIWKRAGRGICEDLEGGKGRGNVIKLKTWKRKEKIFFWILLFSHKLRNKITEKEKEGRSY